LEPEAKLSMPEGAKVLSVQVQKEEAQLWALVDSLANKETRHFITYGTGHQIPDNPGTYIGTFQFKNMGLVFHVFEQIN